MSFLKIDTNGNNYLGGIEQSEVPAITYVHTQATASSEWLVNHNLNKFPSVTVIDSAGDELLAGINYISQNSLTVSFSQATTGKAVCN